MGIENRIKPIYDKAKQEAKSLGVHVGVGAGIGTAYWMASFIFWPLAILPFGPVMGAFGGAGIYGYRKYTAQVKKGREGEEGKSFLTEDVDALRRYNKELEQLIKETKETTNKLKENN